MAATERTPAPCTEADLALIKRIIPHRYPFLLVDKVRDIVPFESAVGIKCVTANEPHFPGHFPDQPIMPGVLIVEALAQGRRAIATFADKGELYASIQGRLSVTDDRQTIERLWNPGAAAWFEGGMDDPKVRLLRLDAENAEIWDGDGRRCTAAGCRERCR